MVTYASKLTSMVLMLAATVVLSIGVAQAALIDQYLEDGDNVFEDDSNEYVFRSDDMGGFDLLTDGDIADGDILLQILDFPIINGTNIDSDGNELTGIALNVVDNLSDPFTATTIGTSGLIFYDAVNFDMVAATAADWLALTGIDITSLGFDETGLITLAYDDANNNLDVNTQGLGTTLGTATDGTLVIALGLTDMSDFIAAVSVPEDIGTFAPSAGEEPGVTIYGSFGYSLSFVFDDLEAEVLSDMNGSGNNLVTDRLAIAAVIDDTQASFNVAVPEPATLTLLGLGFLGFGASRRFGKRRS